MLSAVAARFAPCSVPTHGGRALHRLVSPAASAEPMLSYMTFGDADAPKTCYVLHGLLGSAINWAPFLDAMSSQLPAYRFVVPDLRNHGNSTGFTSPHTLQAVAADVAALAMRLGTPIDALLGHSLGGKVALEMLRSPDLWQAFSGDTHHSSLTPALLPPLPDRFVKCVLLDTVPGVWDQFTQDSDPDSILRIVKFLKSFPLPITSRKELQAGLARAGFSTPVQKWLSANLRRVDTPRRANGKRMMAYEWKFDPATAMELLNSHLVTNAWSTVMAPPAFASVDLVMARSSSRWQCDDNKEALARVPTHRVHEVDAGHWVHVDNPQATASLLHTLLGDGGTDIPLNITTSKALTYAS